MGVQISDIIPRRKVELKDLKGKLLAVDAFNTLYQFLTTIRQQDGASLMDSKGRITSHLSGIFYRNINLLSEGIKLVYVFDGKPPELKAKEIQERQKAKEVAREKYEEAKERGDESEMRKYSAQTVKLTQDIIDESKELLKAMGISVIQADSEGEAEASFLVKNNLCWAAASQDYDALIYGVPRLIRNLTLSRKRRTSSGLIVDTEIELVEFEDVLNKLQIDYEQLVCLAILVGTDYNPGGVRGIGQKRALEIVQKNKFPVQIFDFVANSGKYVLDFSWQEIFKQFKEFKPATLDSIPLENLNKEKIKEILVTKHDFSEERINNSLQKLDDIEKAKKQKGLGDFF